MTNHSPVYLLSSSALLVAFLSSCQTHAAVNTSSSLQLTNLAVETEQQLCYSTSKVINCGSDSRYSGQDAEYTGNQQHYIKHDNGTVSDQVTGLMWMASPDTNNDGQLTKADKLTSQQAADYCESSNFAGYADWQLPTIKQAYSLINFQGTDTSPEARNTSKLTPFIDTDYFDFAYGNPAEGERIIDVQYATSTHYRNDEGTAMLFGVNLADGRIKAYGEKMRGVNKTYSVQCVRGNTNYGSSELVDNQNGTITDIQSGLMWAQNDSGADYDSGINYQRDINWQQSQGNSNAPLAANANSKGAMNWVEALAYVQQMNDQAYLGYSDWRLPNVKELVSLVDYNYSPAKTQSPAIDPLFNSTPITNENGEADWAFYWSSTTHQALTPRGLRVNYASYVAFGRSLGYSKRLGGWFDVHGAGSQRSDPKTWDGTDYSNGHGPQADAIRVLNYVRLVRDANE